MFFLNKVFVGRMIQTVFRKHIPIHEKGFKSSLQTDHRETIKVLRLGIHISKEIYSKMSWTKKLYITKKK